MKHTEIGNSDKTQKKYSEKEIKGVIIAVIIFIILGVIFLNLLPDMHNNMDSMLQSL